MADPLVTIIHDKWRNMKMNTARGLEKESFFDVTISRNSSEPMEDFSFIVKYDDNILEYVRSSSSISVKQFPDRLSCKGYGEDIDGYFHKLGQLVFNVKKCEGTTLKLFNLSGGLAGWGTSDGHLKVKGESVSAPSVSGCVYPNCPGQGFNISGFTFQPYPGYLVAGFLDARSYSPVFQSFGFPGFDMSGGYGYGYPFTGFGMSGGYGYGSPISGYSYITYGNPYGGYLGSPYSGVYFGRPYPGLGSDGYGSPNPVLY